jgi:hypothetical protein
MKNLFFIILLFFCSIVFGTNYYTDSGTSNPNDVNNWWTNADNTGTHPLDFTGASDNFIIQAGHNYATTSVWNVTYNIVVNGVLNANHDITIGHYLTPNTGGLVNIATGILVDVDEYIDGAGDITFTGAGSLYIGKHYSNTGVLTSVVGSTVKYKTNGTTPRTLKPATYYHLIIDKSIGVDMNLSGTANVNGDFTITSGDLDVRTGSILNVAGTTTINTDGLLQFEDTTGDVNLAALNMAGGQLGGALNGDVDCTTLTITGVGNKIDRVDLTVNGITTVTGSVVFSAGTGLKKFQSNFIVDGTVTDTAAAQVEFQADLIVNGTFDATAGKYSFTGTGKSISGSATTVALYDGIFEGSYTNNVDTLKIKDDLSGVGSLTNPVNGVLEVGGESNALTTLIATAIPNTVIFNGAVKQHINATNYYDLIINNSGGSEADSEIDIDADTHVANHMQIISGWVDVDISGTQLTGKDITMSSGTRLELQTRGSTATVPQFTGVYALDVNSTIKFDHSTTYQKINCTGITYGNVVFTSDDNTGPSLDEKQLQGSLDVNGDLSIVDLAVLNVTANNYTINVAGDWISTTAGTTSLIPQAGKVVFDGATAQQITRSGDDGEEDFYDLSVMNSGNIITLNNNVKIDNQLDFTTSGFIDLNGNTFTINNWDDGDITSLGTDRYIIGDNTSTFTINDVDNNETANFPLGFSSSSTDFCRVDILNKDAVNTSFSVNSCNYLNTIGTCSGGTQKTEGIVDITWGITSLSTNADVSLFWDASKELIGFDRANCDLYHYITPWGSLDTFTGSTILSGSIYYDTKNTTSFSTFSVASAVATLATESFEISGTNNINIYPNPTNNQFTIEGNKEEIHGVKIYNILGLEVKPRNILTNESQKLKLDISNLSKGLYLIKTKNTAKKLYKY